MTDPAADADPKLTGDEQTNVDHYEVVGLIYRMLQCAAHCERAIADAERAGDVDLARLLVEALADASYRAGVLRAALRERGMCLDEEAPPAWPRPAQQSDVRELNPSPCDPWAHPVGADDDPSWPTVSEVRSIEEGPLVVHLEGNWFRLPSGEVADCGERHVLRRLLAHLAHERFHRPGRPIAIEELLEAGWPKERMDTVAGTNRLRVALVRLRRLGLHELLRNHEGGYLLDPRVALRITAGEAAA